MTLNQLSLLQVHNKLEHWHLLNKDPINVSAIQNNDEKNLLDLKEAVNWHKSADENRHWLCSDSVHFLSNLNVEAVQLCNHCCVKALDLKHLIRFSLSHVNLGCPTRVGLENLSEMQKMMISTVHLHQVILKLQMKNMGLTDSSGSQMWFFSCSTVSFLSRKAWRGHTHIKLSAKRTERLLVTKSLDQTCLERKSQGDAQVFDVQKAFGSVASFFKMPTPEDVGRLQKEIDAHVDEMIKDATAIRNKDATLAEAFAGSDVGNVRTEDASLKPSQFRNKESNKKSNNHMLMQTCLVQEQPICHKDDEGGQDVKDVLTALHSHLKHSATTKTVATDSVTGAKDDSVKNEPTPLPEVMIL